MNFRLSLFTYSPLGYIAPFVWKHYFPLVSFFFPINLVLNARACFFVSIEFSITFFLFFYTFYLAFALFFHCLLPTTLFSSFFFLFLRFNPCLPVLPIFNQMLLYAFCFFLRTPPPLPFYINFDFR